MTLIGFSTSSSWISAVIRWFTGSEVSHCFIVYYDDEWGRDMVMESEGGLGGSVRIVNLNRLKPNIVKLIEPKHSIEVGMTKMVDKLGDLYDYGGLFGMAWVIFGRWFRKKWQNPLQNSKALFCSELIAHVLIDSGYPNSSLLNPSSTDPEKLLRFLEGEEQQ